MLSRIAISLCLGMFVLPAVCQRPAARQNVTVRVLNASTTPGSPVRDARVAITYLADGTPITDALKTTNAAGEAYLVISRDRAEEGDLRVELSGVNELAVYQPADGQLAGISDKPVLLLLLPKGSVALLGPPQIEATLKRLSLHVSALQQQNRSLRGQLASANSPKDALAKAMAEWAKSNGFPEQEVQDKVREWAEDIQAHAQQKSQEQKALAQFALKNYAAAGTLFNEVADSEAQSSDIDEEKAEERHREALAGYLNNKISSARSFQLNLQYHQATAVLQSATNFLGRKHQEMQNDDQITNFWLGARLELANGQRTEGEVVTGGDSSALLKQAVANFESLATEYEGRSDKSSWAMTQDSLGLALGDQGERTSGEASTALFARAVQAYQSALEVLPETDLPRLFCLLALSCSSSTMARTPEDWAATQNNLGNVLLDQGERTSGEASTALFAQAVQAYQHALEVFTKADVPQDWAKTQDNLGIALTNQGERTSGEASTALFARAVQAYEHALEIDTKVDLPQNWATTQSNLGNVLWDQGERTSGEASIVLFARAVQAYEHALEVLTKADLPLYWAKAQSNLGATQESLGLALGDQGERTSGETSTVLFARAVQAYQSALEVYTKADLPQDWARTQNNLGSVLVDEGERTSGETSTALFAQAVQAYQSALEVRTKNDLPQDWATTQYSLGLLSVDLRDYAAADRDLTGALEVSPQSTEALGLLGNVLHDNLFQFDRAYDLLGRRLKLNSSAGARLDFAEASLSANHAADCIAQMPQITDAGIGPQLLTVRETLKLACQWANSDPAAALSTARLLTSKTAGVQKPGFSFVGTIHFLTISPVFSKGRSSWISLFKSVQDGNGKDMATALQQLEEMMQH